MLEASLWMKDVAYKACCSMVTYGAENWAMKEEAVSHSVDNAVNDLQNELKDKVEGTVIALRVGNLEKYLRQKRLRWFGHIARRDEEVQIKCLS